MSNNPRTMKKISLLLVVTGVCILFPLTAVGLEVTDIALDFTPLAGGRGVQTGLSGLGDLAGVDRLVLEFRVAAPDLPAREGLLLKLALVCRVGSEETELFSTMDLFSVEADGQGRRCLFDLTPLLAPDRPICPPASIVLRLSPVDENIDITFDQEASDAILQIIRR
jgi:hypothetical protein